MKITTWNVNSIRTRLEQVVEWLSQNQVDVLCLQETKVIDAQFPRSPFEELGYNVYISGQKSYNGVAIFSRSPMENVSTGFQAILPHLNSEIDDQKRVITGIIEDIRIINLYVPNGSSLDSEKYKYKLYWLEVLQEYLQILLNSPHICICGDFNIALENQDIHETVSSIDSHIMSSPPEREALQKVLQLGFKDAFRKFTTDGGHYSWWDYRAASFPRNRGWRIDHHYLTPQLYQRAKSCTIDISPRKLPKPSDHTPVILEI